METFVAQIIGLGRITVPSKVRKKLHLKDGDYVQIDIAKVPLKNPVKEA